MHKWPPVYHHFGRYGTTCGSVMHIAQFTHAIKFYKWFKWTIKYLLTEGRVSDKLKNWDRKCQFLEARKWIAVLKFQELSDCSCERQQSAPTLIILVVSGTIEQVHPDGKCVHPIHLKTIWIDFLNTVYWCTLSEFFLIRKIPLFIAIL